MTDVIIFGGTTEGRILAEWLAKRQIRTLVSVATEYGKQTMEPEESLVIHTGRLDLEGMVQLISKEQPKVVLDATHPHAQEVTRLLKRACERLNVSCQRIVRRSEDTETGNVIWVNTAQEAARLVEEDQRAVLLTTGSKELESFTSLPRLCHRIYARVLPDSKVLAACEALGIRGRQLIAMQGPFSVEMNEALLKAVDAGWLVTKESGSSGGFEEKLEAAKRCGVKVVVIRRPQEETGLTVEDAKQLMQTLFELEPERTPRQISLIGMGMGTGRQLTQEALQAIEESDAVLGAPRMLTDLCSLTAGKRTEAIYLGKEIAAWLQENQQYKKVSVIYSGDTGFHSGAASLIRELGQKLQLQVYPGISTVSCLCARFHLSWEKLFLASAHGRDCDVVQLLKEHGRVFLLLGGTATVSGICRCLTKAGMGTTKVFAGVRLGYEDEQLFSGEARSLQEQEMDRLAAVILEWELDQTAERLQKPERS